MRYNLKCRLGIRLFNLIKYQHLLYCNKNRGDLKQMTLIVKALQRVKDIGGKVCVVPYISSLLEIK